MFSLVRPGSLPLGLQPPMARNLTFPESGSLWRIQPEAASKREKVAAEEKIGGKYNGGKKRKRLMIIVATTSLPAVDRPNADRWNAAR